MYYMKHDTVHDDMLQGSGLTQSLLPLNGSFQKAAFLESKLSFKLRQDKLSSRWCKRRKDIENLEAKYGNRIAED